MDGEINGIVALSTAAQRATDAAQIAFAIIESNLTPFIVPPCGFIRRTDAFSIEQKGGSAVKLARVVAQHLSSLERDAEGYHEYKDFRSLHVLDSASLPIVQSIPVGVIPLRPIACMWSRSTTNKALSSP